MVIWFYSRECDLSEKVRTKLRDGRKLPSNEPRSYEIAEMRNVHHRMVELSFLGYSHIDIAAMLDRTPQNISDVLSSDLAKAHIEALQLARDENSITVAKQLKELAPEALRLIKTSLVRKNKDMLADEEMKIDRLHKDIALEILDRTGHTVPKQSNQFHLHLTKSQISNIKNYNEQEKEAQFEEVSE